MSDLILTDEDEAMTLGEWKFDHQPMVLGAFDSLSPTFADIIDLGGPLPPGDYMIQLAIETREGRVHASRKVRTPVN